MLPLRALHFPTSATELETALSAGLADHHLQPRAVTVTGGAWPSLDRLAVDLTGTEATRDLRLPKAVTAPGAELLVGELTVQAEPLRLEGSPVTLQLRATQARLGPATAAGTGAPMLELRGSGPGRLEVTIAREDLQKLALAAGRAAAKEKGADLQDLQLDLHSENERALRFSAKVLAKMGFMKATLVVSGRAEVDAQLQLQLSGLDVQGQGMASSLAAGLIRTKLEKAQQRPIPLAVLALGDVRLREVRLLVDEANLRAEAEFSS